MNRKINYYWFISKLSPKSANWKIRLNKLIKISKNSSFKGSYSGLEDIELLGKFDGTLFVKNLFIKKTGVFNGAVSAEKIFVLILFQYGKFDEIFLFYIFFIVFLIK